MTPRVLTWSDIAPTVTDVPLAPLMTPAFIAYSRGDAVIPPVGELVFEHPPGDVHIKYGYIRKGDHYVVKMASGFYNNSQLGLPSSQGLMVLFCMKTGRCLAVLLDDGRLTDLRTAAAGVLTIKHFADTTAKTLGIIGTGTQARAHLAEFCQGPTRFKFYVWGRTPTNVDAFVAFGRTLGVTITPVRSLQEMVTNCRVLLTTTPSTTPLIQSEWVQPGTHITAIGSDTPTKQELDSRLFKRADRIIVDSITQCATRGEVFRAVQNQHLDIQNTEELGTLLDQSSLFQRKPKDITIADLTGLAVQDLAIAGHVYTSFCTTALD